MLLLQIFLLTLKGFHLIPAFVEQSIVIVKSEKQDTHYQNTSMLYTIFPGIVTLGIYYCRLEHAHTEKTFNFQAAKYLNLCLNLGKLFFCCRKFSICSS